MKPSVGSFGYQFRLLDFTIRSSLAIVLGVVGCVTFYGAFWVTDCPRGRRSEQQPEDNGGDG